MCVCLCVFVCVCMCVCVLLGDGWLETQLVSLNICGVAELRTTKLTFRMSVPSDVLGYERPHGGLGCH